MTIHWKTIGQYFTVFFNFTQCVILENLLILDLALSRVKGVLSSCIAGILVGLYYRFLLTGARGQNREKG